MEFISHFSKSIFLLAFLFSNVVRGSRTFYFEDVPKLSSSDTKAMFVVKCNSSNLPCIFSYSLDSGVWTTPSFNNFLFENNFSGTSITGGYIGTDCGSVTGKALTFKSSSVRSVETPLFYTPPYGSLLGYFYHRLGSGGSCENVDGNEGVVLEAQMYTVSGKLFRPWFFVWTSNNDIQHYQTMRKVSFQIPGTNFTMLMKLRW